MLIFFHIGMKHFPKPSRPKKNITLYSYLVVGFKGLPPRPAYQACQGTTVETHGTPSVSHYEGHGVVRLRGGTGDYQVGMVGEDEVAGHLRGPVGVGLAVGHDDLDAVLLATDRKTLRVSAGLPYAADGEVVGRGEAGQSPGLRAYEPDHNLPGGASWYPPQAGRAGAEQLASPQQRRPGSNPRKSWRRETTWPDAAQATSRWVDPGVTPSLRGLVRAGRRACASPIANRFGHYPLPPAMFVYRTLIRVTHII